MLVDLMAFHGVNVLTDTCLIEVDDQGAMIDEKKGKRIEGD